MGIFRNSKIANIGITDFHTHLLPAIDDGSKNIKQSLKMLNKEKEAGVSRIIATPHFYKSHETFDSFLEKRNLAFKKLEKACDLSCYPELLLGSEVHYFESIGETDDILSLRIQGTDLMLLEMPEISWSEHILNEIEKINENYNITPVIAHIERCWFKQTTETLLQLLSMNILIQSNAEFFYSKKDSKSAINLISNNYINFLGSDCHGIKYRPVDITKAVNIITKKMGKTFFDDWRKNSENTFEKHLI